MKTLREGQMWQGTYGVKYHVLGLYEDYVWTLVQYGGVSAQGQPQEPRTNTRAFYEKLRLVYDPVAA